MRRIRASARPLVGGRRGRICVAAAAAMAMASSSVSFASLKERKREKCAARTKLARMCDKLTKTLVNLESEKTHQKKTLLGEN
jgi:hypothetical protein